MTAENYPAQPRREFSVGNILGESWDMYKGHFGHLVPLAILFYAVLGLITLVLGLVAGSVGTALAGIINFLGIFLLAGALVEAIADVRDGRADLTWGQTIASVKPRFWTLVAASILVVLAIIGGLILFIIPGLIFLTWFSLTTPVVMLEREGVTGSMGRSRGLVRGHGWTVFGILILSWILMGVVNGIISAILTPLPDWLQSYLAQIGSGLTAPFGAIAITLMYFHLSGRDPAVARTEPAPTAPTV